jgi:SAM-dependent methyltransferase
MPEGRSEKKASETNRSVYEQHSIVRQYAAETDLTPAEIKLLAQFSGDIVGKRVLDLGVGGGRTAPYLAERSALYVGVDSSEAMIRACRERYPHLDFRCCDARDLSQFDDGDFDFVLFSYNGIDYVGHDDRARILREAQRVLTPGGALVFSSHNLASVPSGTLLHCVFQVAISANPLQSAKSIARVAINLINYARNAAGQQRTADHAILVDPAHGFTLRTYYVTAEEQRRQLDAAGFSQPIDVVPGTDEAIPYYLYYSARKKPIGQQGQRPLPLARC